MLTMNKFVQILLVVLLLFFASCEKDKRAFVVSKIQSAAKLATTETKLEKIVIGTKEKRILGVIKMNDARFVALSEATLKTGIDLTRLRKENITIEDNSISILLPPVQVLDFEYPFSTFKVDSLSSDNAFLNKMSIFDIEKFYLMSELDIRSNVKYMGISEATKENTRSIMSLLLKNLGFNEIYIEFEEGELFPEIDLDVEEI